MRYLGNGQKRPKDFIREDTERYWLGTAQQEEPFISITYCLKNGETVNVSANENVVLWRGKTRKIRYGDTFVNVVEVLFFTDTVYED